MAKNFRERKQINTLVELWKDVMFETSTYNKENKTFTFTDIKCKDSGFSAKLYCPPEIIFERLDIIKESIEDRLNCHFTYSKEKGNEFADIKIITKLSENK